MENLIYYAGPFKSYTFSRSCSRHGGCFYDLIFTLPDGEKYWSDAFDGSKTKAENYLYKKGNVRIKLCIDPKSKIPLSNGEQKSYGLWINGEKIKSAQDEISMDNFIIDVVFVGSLTYLIVSFFKSIP